MRANEFVDEDLTRRGFLRGLGAAAAAGATGGALAQAQPQPVDASKEFQNMRRNDPRVRHAQDINDLAKAIYQNMVAERGQPADRREQNKWMEIAHLKAEARFAQYKPGAQTATKPAAGFSSQGSEYRRARDIDNFESVEEGAVEDLEKDLDDPKSYSAIDHMMQTIARDHGITGKQLHDKFVTKHGVIPDKWTRDQLRELNFLGSECTKDCSGHRAGYEWSKRKGLRQANSLYSPSFNKGAALAVAGK